MPSVIKCLGKGFNTVAYKAQLLILPIVLDLFLLFGPKLRVSEWLTPSVEEAWNSMLSSVPESLYTQFADSVEVVKAYLASINLFALTQSFPVSVSVLFKGYSATTPLGTSPEVQIRSWLALIPLCVLIYIVGLLLGIVYYAWTSRACEETPSKFSWKRLAGKAGNTILMIIIMAAIVIALLAPVTCVLTLVFMTVPAFYEVAVLLLIALGCWLIVPLFWIPAGIFAKDQNFFESVKESFKLFTWSAPLTVRFILYVIVITLGMNMIWDIPEQTSWLVLIGIFGHAFISTALLASAFILYREMQKWQEENKAFLDWRKANLAFSKLKNSTKKEAENHE